MSYILDAIKKSEQQRQRSKGPSIDTTLIMPYSEKPKSYLLAGLLALGLIVAGVLINHFYPWQHGDASRLAAADATVVDASLQPKAAPQETHLQQVVPIEKQAQLPPAKKPTQVLSQALLNDKTNQKDTKKARQKSTESVEAPTSFPVIAHESTAASKELPVTQNQNKPVLPTAEQAAPAEEAAPTESHPNEAAQQHKVFEIPELPPDIQREIPEMAIAGYAFSINPKERSVGINGRLLQEGDYLSSGLRLEHIGADELVFAYKNYRFRQGL